MKYDTKYKHVNTEGKIVRWKKEPRIDTIRHLTYTRLWAEVIAMSTTIQKIRISSNLSQSQLAAQSGVNLRTLQDFEQGRKPLINAKGEMLYRLSVSLGCSISDLLLDSLSEIEPIPPRNTKHIEQYFNQLSSTPLYGKYYTFPVVVPDCKVDMKRVYPLKQSIVYELHNNLSSDGSITSIILFGSSITMQCTKDSDIDLAVRLNADCTNSATKNCLSETIQELCNWNADIIWYDRIDKSDRIYRDICKGVQIV